jgi:hypothetical protein
MLQIVDTAVKLLELVGHKGVSKLAWPNLVERYFGKLTEKTIRRGVFHNVPDLIAGIDDYLDATNINPHPSPGPQPPTRSSRRSAAAASPSTQSPTKTETPL